MASPLSKFKQLIDETEIPQVNIYTNLLGLKLFFLGYMHLQILNLLQFKFNN